MKRILFQIWRILPEWMQWLASAIIRPHYTVVVVAIIFNAQGQILFCKHTYRRQLPWGLPGGDIKYGEDPAEAVRRELLEETGLSVQETWLMLLDNSRKNRRIALTYLCSGVSGSFVPNDEVYMIQYFDPGALPDIDLEERATVEKILAMTKNSASGVA